MLVGSPISFTSFTKNNLSTFRLFTVNKSKRYSSFRRCNTRSCADGSKILTEDFDFGVDIFRELDDIGVWDYG